MLVTADQDCREVAHFLSKANPTEAGKFPFSFAGLVPR
jgi:hypothetical protein